MALYNWEEDEVFGNFDDEGWTEEEYRHFWDEKYGRDVKSKEAEDTFKQIINSAYNVGEMENLMTMAEEMDDAK